jgi:hypothetical protein
MGGAPRDGSRQLTADSPLSEGERVLADGSDLGRRLLAEADVQLAMLSY